MKPLRTQTVTISSFIKFVFVFALVVLVGGYVRFQSRLLIEGPHLTLEGPENAVSTERVVSLQGSAKNSTSVVLNGRAIDTDEDGQFSEPLVLESDYTIMTLRAKDRYGRETSLTRSFVYTPVTNIN